MNGSREYANLIKFLAKSNKIPWRCKHIKFLVERSIIPGSGLSCDLSGFPWWNLLKKEDLDVGTVQAIVSLGGVIDFSAIRDVMNHVEDPVIIRFIVEDTIPRLKNTEIIRLIRQSKNSTFTEELLLSCDRDALIKHAVRDNCLDIVEILVLKETEVDLNLLLTKMSKGGLHAKPDLISFIKSKPEGCIKLFYKALEHFELNLAIDCLDEGETRRNVDLSKVIEVLISQVNVNKQDVISFIEKLLKSDVNPNRIGSEVPLNAVLRLPDDYHHKLLKLLLQYHADVENCIDAEVVGITLIHTATKLAIDSGKDYHTLSLNIM